MYVLVENGVVKRYPYSPEQIKRANPNISFPDTNKDEVFEAYGLYRVFFSTRPSVVEGREVLEELEPYFDLEAQRWTQRWSVRALTPEELLVAQQAIQDSIVTATQQRLDDFARTRGYDDINSTSKYKDISDAEIELLPENERPLVQKFRTECRYMSLAGARTWARLYILLDEVQAGTRPVPTGYGDIEPELPPLEWPV